MACENDKCEKYGMHHDYKNGVEVRKCYWCERDDRPERSKREDFVRLAFDEFCVEYKSDRGGNWETENGYILALEEFSDWLNQRFGDGFFLRRVSTGNG